MKFEFRKQEKALFAAPLTPSFITVPTQQFVMVDGHGNPNREEFSDQVGVLYSLAYTIKMSFKEACRTNPDIVADSKGYDDFTVYPLEGWWSMTGEDPSNKDSYVYTIMIRQPDFVTQEMFDVAVETVAKKKPLPTLGSVRFGRVSDGECVHMLHVGPFDDEPASFALMGSFVAEKGFERVGHEHREIYLSDFRRVAPEKLRTILRYPVRRVDSPGDIA